jgi:hypothetical protein
MRVLCVFACVLCVLRAQGRAVSLRLLLPAVSGILSERECVRVSACAHAHMHVFRYVWCMGVCYTCVYSST